MNEYNNSYPIKIVSRTASIARLRKLRLSWFVAGVAFSVGCTSALTPISSFLSPSTTIASIEPQDRTENGTSVQEAAQIQTAPTPVENTPTAPLEEIIGAAPAEVTPIPPPPAVQTAENTAQAEETKEVILEKTAATVKAPQELELKVKKGNTFISLLTDAGIPKDEAQNVFDSLKTVFNHRRLDVGSTIIVKTAHDTAGNLIVKDLKMPLSSISTIELSRADSGDFDVKKTNVPLVKKLARAGGDINSSIYQTGAEAGIPASMLSELINAYSYDVDFQRDIKKGNSIDVLFERMETRDGVVAGTGNVVYSELNLGDRVLKIYRYSDKNGIADFYNEKGESIRKALLRTPINGARITSTFGMREHPLYGYSKMHKGVDFGAPTGTPIYAAGDGVVQFASTKGGYGNYLKISHNGKYASAYAHLSRYASGISPGKHVKQGQIVAYVGTTGASTGPHLHYEILVNDQQVNPANVKFKTGNILQGKELAAFKQKMNKLEARLASIGRGKTVAMVDEASDKVTN